MPDTDGPVRQKAKRRNPHSFRARALKRVQAGALEVIGAATAIVAIWLIDLLLKLLIGENAKFLGTIPVAWTFDLLHLAVIGRMIWRILHSKDE